MILLECHFRNVGRIKCVEVKPKPSGLTIIGGDNSAGKTTCLNAICWALGGNRYKPNDPNHRGGDGFAEIDIRTSNGLHIWRKGKNGDLLVKDESTGANGNQSTLDKFVTSFALDLREFRKKDDKGKCDLLLRTLGVDMEYAACEQRIKEAYDQRTALNRIAKQKENAFRQSPKPGELPCDEPIDVNSLVADLQSINVANTERQKEIHQREVLAQTIENRKGEIERLTRMLADLQVTQEEDEQGLAQWPQPPAEIDTTQVQQDIGQANALNAQYSRVKADRDNYERMATEVHLAQKAANDADVAVEQARKTKFDLLAGLTMPDPDIGVDDGELTYKGEKWSALSGSAELIVTTKIVGRLNPECGFVLVDELERLDGKTLADYDKWAQGASLQVIGTRVTKGPEADLIIQDGEVAYAKEPVAA